jgi:hypothetical protein
MRCPSCGRKLNKAEQLWTATHGGRQCSHCWAGVQFLPHPQRGHGHGREAKAKPQVARRDRGLAA